MTVKQSLHVFANMDSFENPQNKPVEDLKLKYKSDESSYEELIPALDKRWCTWDYVFTLYVPPPTQNSDGTFTMGSKEDWLKRMELFIGDMDTLLKMDYHRFWSEVIYNRRCLDGVSSFLQNAPPFYQRDQIPRDEDILRIFQEALESVFLVLLRLTSSRESEKCWMRDSTLADILYNNFVLSFPQLMEICLIYSSDNLSQVTKLVNRVIEIQPKYMYDVEKSAPFIYEVFSKLENSAAEVTIQSSRRNSDTTGTSVDVIKLISLILDIGFSLTVFLDVCPRAGAIYHGHQLEPRIASFYGNTIPVFSRYLESQYNREDSRDQYESYKFKINLCRHQLISAVHQCLTNFLSTILDERDSLSPAELKNRVDNYIDTLSECLSDQIFACDYNSAFPIQKELKVLTQICPEIDSIKCEYLVESVLSLYDLPRKKQNPKTTNSVMDDGPSTSSQNSHSIPNGGTEKCKPKKVTGVELESLITQVKDILPHLGDGFVEKCLEYFDYESADVINALLENTLPDELAALDQDLPLIPPEDVPETSGLPERINVFDNDEFDIMTQDQIDTSRIHKGKRPDKHKNMFEMLNDKSHINEVRDLYTQMSLVEHLERSTEYEDEYDDTYDDVDVPLGNEGDTEEAERRAFVTPRVLQQRKKSLEDTTYDQEEEDEEEKESKRDHFIENPAEVRARQEQRRQEMRARGSGGRSRGGAPHRDVVGKPKGQGQDKDVVISREFKNTHKSFQGNHNRRAMAAKKKRQGMFPT